MGPSCVFKSFGLINKIPLLVLNDKALKIADTLDAKTCAGKKFRPPLAVGWVLVLWYPKSLISSNWRKKVKQGT